ncbi:Clp protease N-terminal domain-containing protein [Streptomyces sp. TS71-3]|uniref:Clp protease N-terminal domain-containing protein n=1 Tax=Streptomyces sp. TS71-3 TaxID=2733862 RepID=UPI0027E254C8|nr:Clp protease N-terminal domain-containing protein [Streptomyces sp. TS71-3]
MLTAAGVTGAGGQDAKDALATLGIDVDEIRRRADDTFGPGRFHFPRPAFTLHAKKAMEMTLRESRALGHEHIGTEHLLLGLIAEEAAHSEANGDPGPGPGGAARILGALDVDPAALRTAVLTRIGPPVGA